MANGIAPGTPNEYDGRACPVPDSDTAGSTSDTDTAGSNVTETDTAGSDAATGDSSDKTEWNTWAMHVNPTIEAASVAYINSNYASILLKILQTLYFPLSTRAFF